MSNTPPPFFSARGVRLFCGGVCLPPGPVRSPRCPSATHHSCRRGPQMGNRIDRFVRLSARLPLRTAHLNLWQVSKIDPHHSRASCFLASPLVREGAVTALPWGRVLVVAQNRL